MARNGPPGLSLAENKQWEGKNELAARSAEVEGPRLVQAEPKAGRIQKKAGPFGPA
jgi:hypothetical protein